MADFGFTTWDDKAATYQKKEFTRGPKMEWVKVVQGSNLIRFVTPPAKYNIIKVPVGGKYGTTVKCAFPGVERAADPGVIAGLRPKQRYYAGVLHRAPTGTAFKIMDLSPLVFEQLQLFKEDYGDPTGYDVNIKYNKDAPAASKYGVIPRPATPLSEADQEVIKAVGMDNVRDYISRICTPPSVDWVTTELTKLGWDGTPGFWKPEPAPSKKEELVEAAEDDFDFKR